MTNKEKHVHRTYDVVIIGGGVTGTALTYLLAVYTNIGRIALVEKYENVAEVNSHPLNNAQTSHDGGTETNYILAHALHVQTAARMLRRYVEAKGMCGTLFRKTNRMVLGVGEEEVRVLEKRYKEFSPQYPDLRLIGREELAKMEPNVVRGRSPDEPIAALVSTEGYAINYQKLAETFLADTRTQTKAMVDTFFKTHVEKIVRNGELYHVHAKGLSLKARSVVCAAGPFSLLFAHTLGYGKEYAVLPVAGSFYSAGELLSGKVYTIQIEGIPFAAIHGDPDVLDPHVTRFGPTVKVLPLLERHHYKTFFDFARTSLSFTGIFSLLSILLDRKIFWFGIKHNLFDLPLIGRWLFLKEVRKIVPTIRYRGLRLRKGAGGIRPQIVNMRTRTLEFGEATIVGDNIIFNTTPSPGASVCLANALRDTRHIISFLGGSYCFDESAFERDFCSVKKEVVP